MKGSIYTFYSESDVRSACIDILEDLPQVSKDRFFMLDEEKYGTLSYWSGVFSLHPNTIKSKLNKASKQGIKGKLKGGQMHIFYSESDVRSACAEFMEELPQADEDGFFEKDNDKWGTVKTWERHLEISYSTIISRLEEAQAQRNDRPWQVRGRCVQGCPGHRPAGHTSIWRASPQDWRHLNPLRQPRTGRRRGQECRRC